MCPHPKKSLRLRKKRNQAERWLTFKSQLPRDVRKNYRIIRPTRKDCPECCIAFDIRDMAVNLRTQIFTIFCKICKINLVFHLEDYFEEKEELFQR